MYFLNLQVLTLLLVIRATDFVPTSYHVHLCCLNSLTASCTLSGAYQVALVVKNRPANVGDIRDVVWSPGQLDPLEEGMAIHSSNLAWRIPWTEEPGGLWSTGLQRVRHHWRDLACTHIYSDLSLFLTRLRKWCI